MTWLQRSVFATVFLVSALPTSSAMQEIPPLTVSPDKATILLGETRTFRAVGKDGRMRHNVHWSISPEYAAKLTTNGDEAVVQAEQEVSSVVLTAYAEGDSAEAAIDIRSGALPAGTTLWSVGHMPGCKEKQMSQAVPSANGPDLYVEEECPQSTFVRALTSDGREMWRKQISGAGADLTVHPVPKAEAEPPPHPIDLHSNSVCDGISPGMTKNEVAKLVNGRKLQLGQKELQGDNWSLEEHGSRCTISFDGKTGTVVKKRKIIVTD
jgi:hypothetical protein